MCCLPNACDAKTKMPLAWRSRAGLLISKVQLKWEIIRAQERVVQPKDNISMIWQFAHLA